MTTHSLPETAQKDLGAANVEKNSHLRIVINVVSDIMVTPIANLVNVTSTVPSIISVQLILVLVIVARNLGVTTVRNARKDIIIFRTVHVSMIWYIKVMITFKQNPYLFVQDYIFILFSGCQCNSLGSTSDSCNQTTGACDCKNQYSGLKCEECRDGYFSSNNDCVCKYQND